MDALCIDAANPVIVLTQVLICLDFALLFGFGRSAAEPVYLSSQPRHRQTACLPACRPTVPCTPASRFCCAAPLLQDMARDFAGEQSEKDKFECFMKATEFDK